MRKMKRILHIGGYSPTGGRPYGLELQRDRNLGPGPAQGHRVPVSALPTARSRGRVRVVALFVVYLLISFARSIPTNTSRNSKRALGL